VSKVSARFGTPVNALIVGAVVSCLFVLLVFASPDHDITIGFITYPANVNALVALVSFGVSGIYLSFLLTVIGAIIARRRGWVPEGRFQLGRWGWLVTISAAVYLALMLVNVVAPTGLASPRGYFNLDWITLLVIAIIAVVGAAYFFVARPDRGVSQHVHDDLERSGAEREGLPGA
jgi:amino acid transporter